MVDGGRDFRHTGHIDVDLKGQLRGTGGSVVRSGVMWGGGVGGARGGSVGASLQS